MTCIENTTKVGTQLVAQSVFMLLLRVSIHGATKLMAVTSSDSTSNVQIHLPVEREGNFQ